MSEKIDKKTILYIITQSEIGGAQKYIFDLARSLHNEYNIAVAAGEQGEDGILAKNLNSVGVGFYAINNLKRNISPFDDILSIFETVRLLKKIKPDITHLNSSKVSIIGPIAHKIARSNSKLVYTAHGWVFNEPLSFWKKSFYKYAEKFTSIYKNKIICVSEFDRTAAISNNIAPSNKLVTIHNGIEEIQFLEKEKARHSLSTILTASNFILNKDDILLGSIGNLYKTKGYEYLINAIKILKDNKINLKTIIIGGGKEKKELDDWAKQLNVQNNICFAGSIKGAAKYLKAFDIYVCSSIKEGLSYTLIEAMMAGLPIVTTNVGGNKELISNENEGLIVDSEKPEKIANAISRLLNDAELSLKLGVNAKNKAHKEFFIEKMIEKTKSIYKEL